jgi:hypothetical protein
MFRFGFVVPLLRIRRVSENRYENRSNSPGLTSSDIGEDVKAGERLFAVGDPDVFDLGGVLEEEAVGGRSRVEPVDLAAFVGEDLF